MGLITSWRERNFENKYRVNETELAELKTEKIPSRNSSNYAEFDRKMRDIDHILTDIVFVLQLCPIFSLEIEI